MTDNKDQWNPDYPHIANMVEPDIEGFYEMIGVDKGKAESKTPVCVGGDSEKVRKAYNLEKAVKALASDLVQLLLDSKGPKVENAIEDAFASESRIMTLPRLNRVLSSLRECKSRLKECKHDIYAERLQSTYVARYANGAIYCPEGCAPQDDQSELVTAWEVTMYRVAEWPRFCQECGKDLSKNIPDPA